MTSHTLPIVGAHYRPPAKAILQSLPHGTELSLVPEPDNQHDRNAIKVELASSSIPEEAHEPLSLHLGGYGFELADIIEASEAIHLGYIPRTEAEWLAPKLRNQPLSGTFTQTLEGNPAVSFDLDD